MILRADLRLRQRQHLDRVLRIGEALKPTFAKGIKGNDWYGALPDLIELVQHTWAVDANILTEEKHAVGVVEVLNLHRTDWHADGLGQSNRGALVAHIGAVGQIVGPVHACE